MKFRSVPVCAAVLATLAVAVAGASAPAGAAVERPTVTSVSPASGPTGGGTRVVVHGSGFIHVTAVRFGAVSVTGKQVSIASSHRLVVIAPAHDSATTHVRVVTANGTSAAHRPDEFRYLPVPVVSSVAPNGGLPAGSTRVTITGANLTDASKVEFGKVPGTLLKVLSSHRLQVTSPNHSAGTVHVRVITPRGTSAALTTDEFTYEDAPEPVSALDIADSSATSATLRWTPSPSPGVGSVMIRRADGPIAPGSPTSGIEVALVPATDTHYLDPGLDPAGEYTYAVFSVTAAGPLYSTPAVVNLVTPPSSGVTDFAIAGRPTSGSACSGPYGFVTPNYPFTLSAQVPLPDGSSEVHAQFTLWDLGPSGAQDRNYVIGPNDAIGHVAHVREQHGFAIVWLDDSGLTDGHLYGVQVDADDGNGYSVTSGPCHFWYEAGHPRDLTITPSKTTVHVGDHLRFTFSAVDPAPADGGRVSGIDHFEYSFASGGEITGDGPRVPAVAGSGGRATGTLRFTPTVWGTNIVYVAAVDAAGNSSGVAYYSYYVQS